VSHIILAFARSDMSHKVDFVVSKSYKFILEMDTLFYYSHLLKTAMETWAASHF